MGTESRNAQLRRVSCLGPEVRVWRGGLLLLPYSLCPKDSLDFSLLKYLTLGVSGFPLARPGERRRRKGLMAELGIWGSGPEPARVPEHGPRSRDECELVFCPQGSHKLAKKTDQKRADVCGVNLYSYNILQFKKCF